ncbi:MAG: pilus assembly protein TadG-related protein [Syntrophales bacterium]|jgi:hypothetical protein|nr:pilus assembly protein TadG-related protein [Syntrophales bacterium]MDY0044753.1 TadG family pilus assembly protein [Syntrophales bacterium]
MGDIKVFSKPSGQNGIAVIMVALTLFLMIGFAALAVDVSYLFVAKNELQNAADAGALAGARVLYESNGQMININANQTAYDAAVVNLSAGTPVEVEWTGGNAGDVQRGHWSFGLGDLPRGFYPNPSDAVVDLWNTTDEELDGNIDFINSVRVVARRKTVPVVSFFSKIFGHESFELSADAVAYLGFAGTLTPWDLDAPLAICSQSILVDETYSCSIGRMINSGSNPATHQTGGWTNMSQEDACSGGTNASEVKNLVVQACSADGINPQMLYLGENIATNGGEIQSAFNELYECWASKTGKATTWNLTLPVIDCPGQNVGPCEKITGAVNLNIIWIEDKGNKIDDDAPFHMDDWNAADDPAVTDINDGSQRWSSFVNHFNLQNSDGTPAPFAQKSIYFKPDCTPHEPAGVSGGANYGILAKVPVLVE